MGTGRILIADGDNPGARELRARLEGLGHEVVAIASSGAEAVARTAETTPNLVLMSASLEGGSEAAGEIHQGWPVPIVFLTADTSPDTLKRVGVTGAFGYVVKPYAERELRMNIEMALYQAEMTAEARDIEDRFFAVSIDMLCVLDFSGYFKRLNPAWENTLGFTRAEMMSRPFIELVHPDDRARTLDQNRDVRGGGQALSFENRYLCKDGSYRWLLWNAAPDFGQRVIYSVARDITDRKLAEEERERLVRDLRAALAEVRTLREILPICSYCKKIRNDENYWQSVEAFISQHTNSRFSHSICPTCYKNEVEPQLADLSDE
jgi:PAS domain S-box-containing protein